MDLKSNYQNAVDCLVHCEYIIKSLQEQLAEKDDHISSLEERLVKMSLDLASAKAKQDEQRQELLHRYKHQVDGYSQEHAAADVQDDGDVLQQLQAAVNKAIQDDPSIQVAVNKAVQNDPSIGASSKISSVGYAPISCRARGKNNSTVKRIRKTSSTSREDEDVGFMSWPSPQESNGNDVVQHPRLPFTNDGAATTTTSSSQIKRHPRPERRGGFSMRALSKHFNWNDNDNDCTTNLMPKLTSSKEEDVTDLDDSSIRSGLTDSAKESAYSDAGSVLYSQCSGLEKDSSARHTTRYSRSSSTQAHDTTRYHNHIQSSNALDETVVPPTRRLSNFGQAMSTRFLGGFNNNSHSPAPTTTTKKKLSTSLLSSASQHSVGSILSELSGVVFPVSSDDCLRGLERRITKKVTPVYPSCVLDGSTKKGHRRSSSMNNYSSNANTDWPDFVVR